MNNIKMNAWVLKEGIINNTITVLGFDENNNKIIKNIDFPTYEVDKENGTIKIVDTKEQLSFVCNFEDFNKGNFFGDTNECLEESKKVFPYIDEVIGMSTSNNEISFVDVFLYVYQDNENVQERLDEVKAKYSKDSFDLDKVYEQCTEGILLGNSINSVMTVLDSLNIEPNEDLKLCKKIQEGLENEDTYLETIKEYFSEISQIRDLGNLAISEWTDIKIYNPTLANEIKEKLEIEKLFIDLSGKLGLDYVEISKQNIIENIRDYRVHLNDIPNEFKDDEDVVMQAVKNYGNDLEYASDRLKNDEKIVLEAIKNNGKALQFASNELKNDVKIVLNAVASEADVLNDLNKDMCDYIINDENLLKIVKENSKQNPEILNKIVEDIKQENNKKIDFDF